MKVTLHYIFSKKPRWGSRLIAWGSNKHTPLENTPAHIAMLVNNRWVFESTYKNNVSIMSYDKWKELNIETHKLKCSKERTLEEIMIVTRSIKGKKYDWMGILYFSWRFILFITLKLTIPKANKWEKEDNYFCCEAVGKITGKDYSMKTPAGLYIDLKEELQDVR